MGIFIRGIGAAIPETIVSNHQIAERVDTSHEWIVAKTGILERHICPPNVATSDLACDAAVKCLENAGSCPEEVDLIIVATSSPDQIQPAVACIVQDKLGISARHTPAFDINSVCAGFIYALNVGQSMMLSQPDTYRQALVIGADVYSKILNWDDRKTCVYFGDAAGAVLLAQTTQSDNKIDFVLGSDGRGSQFIGIPAGGTRMPVDTDILEQRLNTFYMDGPKVWEFAVGTIPTLIKTVVAQNGLTLQDIDVIIFHQANMRMIQQMMGELGLPEEKTVMTVEHYGNTAAASIPVTLNMAFEQGKLFPGAKVVLTGFGGGLSWGAALLEW